MSRFLPFGEALAVARSLNLPGRMEWKAWCQAGMCPPNVPSNPQRTYKDGGWQGWGHWLGSGSIKKASKFAPFGQALTFARSLGLASEKEWRAWRKGGTRPPNVPSAPDQTYKGGGWQGWGHWLGSSNLKKASKFLPFGQALAFAQSLSLANNFEWRQWCKEGRRPPNVPRDPSQVYKDGGWQGWGHWLGTGNTKHGTEPFLPFGKALVVTQLLRLANRKEWEVWCKAGMRPANVPSRPDKTYKDGGWQGWVHWLGTGYQRTKQFLPFGEALAVARSLNLASSKEWAVWCKQGTRPPNVPSRPDLAYKDAGWQGHGHWLGTGNIQCGTEQFLPFDECLRAARHLQLVSQKEWVLWCRSGARPANVPAAPDKVYVHDGWMGWGHFLRHANLGAATAPAAARPGCKRAAAGCQGASDKGRSKRQRR